VKLFIADVSRVLVLSKIFFRRNDIERILDYSYSELISVSFDLLPSGIANKLSGTHFFTGTDPVFAGLFDYSETSDGRSYQDVWCVAYPEHLTMLSKIRRQTTVIMPALNKGRPLWTLPMIVIHELGHILDEILGFSHIAEPITEYAKVDRAEAFAEAFTVWLNPAYSLYYKVREEGVDKGTLALFRELEIAWR